MGRGVDLPTNAPPCLDPDTLAALADGLLAADQLDNVDRHLDTCASCRTLAADFVRRRSSSAAGGEALERDPLIRRGTTLGRYVVIEAIGRGGMGVVYRAYDPQLDRKVALKVLREEAQPGDVQAQVHLLHEATVMARLAHPNVVSVFDAGLFDGRCFLAMELVEGRSLQRWRVEERRSWRATRDAFLSAGRGLVAAHEAGIVHRDFKPGNVIVGADGRVRVTDFGLALVSPRGPASVGQPSSEGATAGTPSYMAPEQMDGRPADARADQFSFCVALYEAWCDAPPYAGDTVEALRAAIAREDVRPFAKSSPVPLRLRAAVLRGLRERPEDRHASLAALLQALGTDPPAWWRWPVVAASVGLAAALVAAGAASRLRGSQALCEAAPPVGLWEPARREVVQRAFAATAKPYALDAWRSVDTALGAFSESWAAMRREACRATRVDGAQSDEVLSLRVACLDKRLLEAQALASLFESADAAMLERAPEAVARLSRLHACADVAALLAPAKAPAAARVELERLRAPLARAEMLFEAGRDAETIAEADRLLKAAQPLQHAPLEASLLMLKGRAQGNQGAWVEASKTLNASALAAEAGTDSEGATRAYLELANTFLLLGKHDECLLFAAHAAASRERLGPNDELEGRHEVIVVSAAVTSHYRTETAARSLERIRAAKRFLERGLGPGSLRLAAALSLEGSLLTDLEQHSQAIDAQRRAVEITSASKGALHPETARKLHNLADTLFASGQVEEAIGLERQALAIRQVATPGHPLTAWSQAVIGAFLVATERHDDAIAQLERALPLVEKAYGKTHPRAAAARQSLGDALSSAGRPREALREHEAVVALLETQGAANIDLGLALAGLGRDHLQLNSPHRAVEPLERGVKVLTGSAEYPSETAKATFALAEALWDDGASRPRAYELALAAHEVLAKASPLFEPTLKACTAWLATHERPDGGR